MFANVFQPRFYQFRCGPLLREVVCRIAHAPAFMSIFLVWSIKGFVVPNLGLTNFGRVSIHRVSVCIDVLNHLSLQRHSSELERADQVELLRHC